MLGVVHLRTFLNFRCFLLFNSWIGVSQARSSDKLCILLMESLLLLESLGT